MRVPVAVFILLLFTLFTFNSCKKNNSCQGGCYTPLLPAWYNLFNNTNGWIGADIASSIPLDSAHVLWLYGDTWWGSIVNNKRVNATITANNSIAIQTGLNPSTAHVQYYSGAGNSSFFTPSDGIGEIWPMHGIVINSQLYIFFVQVTSNGQGGVWGFQLSNSRLVKISNPYSPPYQWQMTQFAVPQSFFNTASQIAFGAAVLKKDNYVYIYGTNTDSASGNRYLEVARVDTNNITNFQAWNFYNHGQWINNLQGAGHLASDVGFDLSVSYLPSVNKYVLVTTAGGLSADITMQYADSAWGNFGPAITVYTCPEVKWGNNIFCYAGKAHPEISTSNQLIVTYASNSNNLDDIVNNAGLYWPRFVPVSY